VRNYGTISHYEEGEVCSLIIKDIVISNVNNICQCLATRYQSQGINLGDELIICIFTEFCVDTFKINHKYHLFILVPTGSESEGIISLLQECCLGQGD